jgi:hypothetical protein
MTEVPQNSPDSTASAEIDTASLLQSLRRKEGNWVEWGRACQTLQKLGYTPQSIFEETGFEPIQQNQIIVAAQVYTGISANLSEAAKAHFERRGSDVLYELRILSQPERAALAELVLAKSLDMDEAKDAAKAVKDFSRFSTPPEGFTSHPGDAIAYQSWKLAKQKADLQERSRLIARALRFAQSESARKKIEQLLTDFSVTPAKAAPTLPFYRLESEEHLPRLLPVVGKLPLTRSDLQAVPLVEEIPPFNMVQFSGIGALVPIPGWQVILAAEDPVALLCDSATLPNASSGRSEEVLVVVDRAKRTWDDMRYFLVEQAEQLQIQWFEQQPELPLLGQVLLIMRPKKVLDEDFARGLPRGNQGERLDTWEMDE